LSSLFISYSSKDEALAREIHSLASEAGIKTFLAVISIEAGDKWTKIIFEELEKAEWVFYLASKNSINSPAVHQELGASFSQKKTIIPILVDISIKELPVWINTHQAIDLSASPDLLARTISKIAKEIKKDKFWLFVIIGVIIMALFLPTKNKKSKKKEDKLIS